MYESSGVFGDAVMLSNPRRLPRSANLRLAASGRLLLLLGSALALVSSGCTGPAEYLRNGFKVGPNYKKPPAPVANEWIDSRSVNTSTDELNSWWVAAFNDPVLNSLIDEAYRQNLDVRTAGTRILAARALRNIAAGNLFPQMQEAFADISHNAVSGNIANLPPGFRRWFDDNAVGLNLSWEIDFWGRFRRGVESADATLDASIENYDDALVLMISEIASNYVQIRTFQQRLKYVEANLNDQRTFVKQAETRLEGGVARRIDTAQSNSNLSNTLALKEQLELGMRLANNRLCVLLGIPVRDLVTERLGDGPIPVARPELGFGMPVDLLRRRPDVRRAERLVAAQSARIGIATANLYPRFTLIGSLGYEAEHFGDLFNSKSFFGTIGPDMRWDILNYGRLLNGIRVEDAVFQTRVLEYQSTVLRAGREVEDGIVTFLRAQTQTRHLERSAGEARVAVKEAIALNENVKQFDINRSFVTSNFATGVDDSLAVARGDIALGLIQIYKGLGGGWQIRLAPATPPEVIVPIPVPGPGPLMPVPPEAMPSARAQLLPPQILPVSVSESSDASAPRSVSIPKQLPAPTNVSTPPSVPMPPHVAAPREPAAPQNVSAPKNAASSKKERVPSGPRLP